VGRRTKARECAFQMLYQWDMTKEPIDKVIEAFWRVRTTMDATRARADAMARGTHADLKSIDAAITKASTNWRFERIAAVDRNVLRLGVFELIHEPGTPSPVIIDEAVEMARRFGEGESPSFVNGVLDAIMRTVRKTGEGKSVRGA
jgi:N utilization substance protein B